MTDFIGLFNLKPFHVAAGPFCGLHSPFALAAKSYQHRPALLYFRSNNGLAFKGFTSTYFAITDSPKISKLQMLHREHDLSKPFHPR